MYRIRPARWPQKTQRLHAQFRAFFNFHFSCSFHSLAIRSNSSLLLLLLYGAIKLRIRSMYFSSPCYCSCSPKRHSLFRTLRWLPWCSHRAKRKKRSLGCMIRRCVYLCIACGVRRRSLLDEFQKCFSSHETLDLRSTNERRRRLSDDDARPVAIGDLCDSRRVTSDQARIERESVPLKWSISRGDLCKFHHAIRQKWDGGAVIF